MKQAQDENPLAGRGFKKQVVLLIHLDGFRMDMMSADAAGALLHAPASKMITALAIDNDTPVWFGCDASKMSYGPEGIYNDAMFK